MESINMAENIVELLTDVADAIREKKGTTDKINAQNFAEEIRNLPSGGEVAMMADVSGSVLIGNQVESIVIGKAITKLGENCFLNYANLKSVQMHDDIIDLSYNAFSGCSSLESIDFPKNLVALPNGTCKNCTSLRIARLQNNIKSIGNTVFNGCSSLKTVVILQSDNVITLYNTNSFVGNAEDRLIYVPDDLVDSYKSATNWSTYADVIRPISELPNE